MAVKGWGDSVEPNCPKCGASYGKGDRFCAKCGTKLRSSSEKENKTSPFEMEVMELSKTLKEFREWVDQNQKKNVRFMKAYKRKIQRELGPMIRGFDEKYEERKEDESRLFRLILEVFSALSRPVNLMETELRPSVGMGVFLERWMMRSAAESYLKECCEQADRLLDELTKKIEPIS